MGYETYTGLGNFEKTRNLQETRGCLRYKYKDLNELK